MDLKFSPEEQAFRREVRQFIDENLPTDLRRPTRGSRRPGREETLRWHKILYEKGWVAPEWPEEYGGTGWNPIERHIFDEECADAGTPILPAFGLRMVAPVIMAFGSDAQKEYFLPRILSGEHWWCQGYSEPGAGSDLASVKTRAERHGDHYLVNGQKTWTTLAQYANWIFCLVRTGTEGRKQETISFILIDMTTPGVTVRPIIMVDGSHEINEVWLENVKVPAANLVGEENKGWTYAKFLLGHERTGIAGVGRSKAALKRLKSMACRELANGRPLIEDQRFRDKIAQVEMDLAALEITNLRVVSAEQQHRDPGPEASILKIKGSEIQQALSELAMQAMGHYALGYKDEATDAASISAEFALGAQATREYLNLRKTTIYGGANEIQKNIISRRILGL